MSEDIRWRQRLTSYKKALSQLAKFIDKGNLSELEQQGLIHAFEYTYELAWNLLRDYLNHQGLTNMIGSRDVFREVFAENLIRDGENWMDMIKSRNLTAHSYNQDIADEIADAVFNKYHGLFLKLEDRFSKL